MKYRVDDNQATAAAATPVQGVRLMFASARVSHPNALLVSGLFAAISLLAGPMSSASTGFTVLNVSSAGASSYQGTAATVIDASGNVAGIYIDANKVEHAFVRYAAKGTIVTFDAPGAGTSGNGNTTVTVPIGFDGSGNLIGIASDANGVEHGFVRTASTGTVTNFDAPNAGTSSDEGTFPASVNAAGQIAGVYIDSNDVSHGFIRSASGTITSFDAGSVSNLNGSYTPSTYVDSMNAGGDVAGAYLDSNGVIHGFVRLASTKAITLVDAPNAGTTEEHGTAIVGIDTKGDVTGIYVDAKDVAHGFIRLASTKAITVIDAPGAGTAQYQGTAAMGMNANGDVIGMYADINMVVHGFVRTANGTISAYSAPGANVSANMGAKLASNLFGNRSKHFGEAKSSDKGTGKPGGILGRLKGFMGRMVASAVESNSIFGNSTTYVNGSGGMYFGTLALGNVGLSSFSSAGAVTGIYTDGDAVAHGYVRSANGAITSFDAPGAGTVALTGTGGFSINASGTIAGAYADSRSVIHGFILTLGQTATTTTVKAVPDPSTFGAGTTLTATVAAGSSKPANGEKVWFLSGTTALGSGTLSSGTATLTTTALPGGSDSITAVYGGDTSYAGSTSAAFTQTVNKANSTTKLTATSATSLYGQYLTFKAVITGQLGGTATGTVTFKSGSTTLGTSTLIGGLAELASAQVPLGVDSITAVYAGDGNFYGSTSSILKVTISQATPTLTWATPTAVPAGTTLGAAQLDAVATVPGKFTYSPVAGTVLKAGSQTLSVSFTPTNTAAYATAKASVTLTVSAAGSLIPTVTVTPASTKITTANTLLVTITVTGKTGKSTPTGSVILSSGSYSSSATALSGGSVNIEIPAELLATGSDTLTATYTPDSASWSTYASAKGTSSAITVSKYTAGATTTVLAVTSGSAAVTTVSAGKVVTLTATVKAGTKAITTGQVNFCDASAAFCTDIHLLGTAQLTKTGTATIKLRPGIGNHSYKAVFAGTKSNVSSFSGISALIVSAAAGGYTATTAISASGSVGNYSLTATVGGPGATLPTGTVSFLDSTYGNAVLGTATLKANAAGLSWVQLPTPATGYYAHSEVAADFNGDGIPDLAILSDNGVVILLGNGDGNFTQAAKSPLAIGASDSDNTSIAVGDFNSDGIADLIVTNTAWSSSGSVGTAIVLLGNGNGTFTASAKSPFATGKGAAFAAVADFNGDGNADLAVLNGNGANTLTILLGNGTGGFSTSNPITVGNSPSFAVAGDFNADGKVDLAVANQGDNTVTILLGNGNGGFAAAKGSPVSVGNNPISIAMGDINGDGKLDLAVANAGNAVVSILQGNNDGTFISATSQWIALSNSPQSISIGDFNGDGIADLVTIFQYSGTEAILLGNGKGIFTPVANPPASGGYNPLAVAVGDFNGDGVADLVVTNANSTTASVQLTTAQSAIATVNKISVTGLGPHQTVASYPGNSTFNSSTSGPTALYTPTPTPTISLASGKYTGTQMVKVTDTATKTTIYYTTDGSTPDTYSTQYMGVIKVSSSETVKAIAVASGYAASAAATATYTIK
jgi:hypothetical protein